MADLADRMTFEILVSFSGVDDSGRIALLSQEDYNNGYLEMLDDAKRIRRDYGRFGNTHLVIQRRGVIRSDWETLNDNEEDFQ